MEVYRRKLRELRDVIEPVFFRLEETAARPQLVNDTVTFITEARALVAKWNTTHPQVSEGRAYQLCFLFLGFCALFCGRDIRDTGRFGSGARRLAWGFCASTHRLPASQPHRAAGNTPAPHNRRQGL